MKNNIFRWAVIGPGRIAERFAEAVSSIENACIYAVASRDMQRAKEFSLKHDIPLSFEGYEKIVDCSEIDAVYIATPINFHYEHVKMCLEAGIPVLCEKSFTINQSEAESLFSLAYQNNVFLMEAMWTPFLPVYSVVRDWLNDGVIGPVKHLQSSFGFAIPRDLHGRELNHDLGGGVLLEMGIYNIAVSRWLMGKDPIGIQAMGYVGETEVDEVVSVNMSYGDDVVSQFTCSYRSQLSNDFVISGALGEIRIHPMFWDNGHASLKVENETLSVSKPFKKNGFEYQIEHVMECVHGGLIESSIMPHSATRGHMHVMDEIRKQIGFKYRYEV